ncbi:response regulator transcription factor [Agilicoccus flavus]|uniref:response regulator transcription factor n=1 Tax=Agilicoccus flavus TaxID=2775968 RepID=UPI001CF60D7D|nr:response regulator transcription factor [Agilicoccus flavus]
MTIRVVVADDQEMVRLGLSMILRGEDDIEVVAECDDGPSAVEAVRRLRPDVALLDIRMPRLDGLEAARLVAQDTRVVIVTTFGDDDLVDRALDVGVAGFVLKDAGPPILLAAVRAAAAGDALISPEVTVALLKRRGPTGRPATDPRLAGLSDRELDVVALVARGRTNAEIAADLSLSVATVKTHLVNASRRLGVRNRVEIAALAWSSGLVR